MPGLQLTHPASPTDPPEADCPGVAARPQEEDPSRAWTRRAGLAGRSDAVKCDPAERDGVGHAEGVPGRSGEAGEELFGSNRRPSPRR